jgi:hypothetical protein
MKPKETPKMTRMHIENFGQKLILNPTPRSISIKLATTIDIKALRLMMM